LPDAADGWGPLHFAVNIGSMRVLQLLLAHPGVNVDMKSRSGRRPLDVCNSAEAARALLDAGAAISGPSPGCVSALHYAAYTSRDTVVDVLLARGANVRETFSAREGKQTFNLPGGGEALHLAAYALKNARAISEITPGLAALCDLAGSGLSNAHTMATRRVAVVNALLRAGADVNARATTPDNCRPTALHHAAGVGDAAVIRALLASGASVDAVDVSLGRTALVYAARYGSTDAVYALVAGGADVNAPVRASEEKNYRPLHYAILENRHAAATALLELGADTSHVESCLASSKVDDAMRALLARFVARGRAPPPARECALPGCQARRRAAYNDAKLMICGACKVRLSLWARDADSGTDSQRRPWRTAARSISASTGLHTRLPARRHETTLEARSRATKRKAHTRSYSL
jgi:ankyrin repeat protein